MKKLPLFLAALLAACSFSACELLPQLPFLQNSSSSSPSSSNGSSLIDNSSPDNASDSSSIWDSSSEINEELLQMQALVDEAWTLGVGEYLDGTHELTGTVIKIQKSSGRDTITIEIEGRKTKPIYCFGITGEGVSSLKLGDIATVSGKLTNYKGTIEFDKGCVLLSATVEETPPLENDPYASVSKTEFYINYSPATSNEDAYFRSIHGLLSGSLTVPDQAPVLADERPMRSGKYVRNESMLFDAENEAYTVVNAQGEPAFTVYKDGAYIALEEVAAYVYAFGTYPANHSPSKSTSPGNSPFGEYLRVNHTSFSGSTSKYPYEPELPNITGCGGKLNYYEMDIGTTGTDCDPSYPVRTYNDGIAITRGAARIVYGKNDLNGNGVYELGEFHVFYTYNHYNDFQEYLNYEGGWGETFGNITGGGTLSSKTDYNPTAYPSVVFAPLN